MFWTLRSQPSLELGGGVCVPGPLDQVDPSLLRSTKALGWSHSSYDNRQERNISSILGPGVRCCKRMCM